MGGHRIEPEPKRCLSCGNMFGRRNQKLFLFNKQKCCSRKCNAAYVARTFCIGKKAHNNIQTEIQCKQCGKKRLEPPSHHCRPFCNRKCMKDWLKIHYRGDAHWNWQGGITEKQARDILYPGYKEWRKAVYRRDNWTCRMCGSKKSGILRAHHIEPVKKRPDLILDINNGLTVCKPCHSFIHYGHN